MSSPPVHRPEIRALRPWYHDFQKLGLITEFGERAPGPRELLRRGLGWLGAAKARRRLGLPSPGFGLGMPSHVLNQQAKESVLLPMLERCLEARNSPQSALDLFCADGYYSCWLARAAAGARVLGVDRAFPELVRARAAAAALGCGGARFLAADVPRFVAITRARFDLVLCAGGLYHLDDPAALLAALGKVCRRNLVIQTVVTLESESPDFFVRPAPGWRHGCRFTDARLRRWLEEQGWEILAHQRGELPANRRLCDRGSSYLLARAPR